MSFTRFFLLLLCTFFAISLITGRPISLQRVAKFAAVAETNADANANARAQDESKIASYKKLYSDGLISKKELTSLEEKYHLDEAEQTLKHAVAQKKQPDNSQEESIFQPISYRRNSSRGSSRHTVYRSTYKRNSYSTKRVVYKMAGPIIPLPSLEELKEYYQNTFHESLPISAMGQSETHNRLGWDHSGRVDVAIQPDSEKGQAVVNFLRSHNIGFIAFRSAVPGCATGPHIHIGPPSTRLQ